LGILLTWCGYIAFVFLTDCGDYGLNAPRPEAYWRWIYLRLATASVWLFLAAFLLWYRENLANLWSFLSSFIATSIPAALVFGPLVSQGDKYFFAIAGAIVFYAAFSGLVCMSITNPRLAALLGLALFPAQLLVDATAQVFSGVFRFQ
jgi:hypothetical protein